METNNYKAQIDFIYEQMKSIEAKTNNKYMKELFEAYEIYVALQNESSKDGYLNVNF